MYVTNVWYKRHYLVPLHGVSTAVLPLLKFQPSYIKLGTELLHIMPFINYELRDSRSNESYVLLKGMKDILSVFLRLSSNLDRIPYKKSVSSNNH
jgi:hypothetical protein